MNAPRPRRADGPHTSRESGRGFVLLGGLTTEERRAASLAFAEAETMARTLLVDLKIMQVGLEVILCEAVDAQVRLSR
jgi:hypothetical protein